MSGWDGLTPSHRREIVDHVRDWTITFGLRISDDPLVLEDVCRFAIDALGRSTPLEDEYARGFEEGRQQGFGEGADAHAMGGAR